MNDCTTWTFYDYRQEQQHFLQILHQEQEQSLTAASGASEQALLTSAWQTMFYAIETFFQEDQAFPYPRVFLACTKRFPLPEEPSLSTSAAFSYLYQTAHQLNEQTATLRQLQLVLEDSLQKIQHAVLELSSELHGVSIPTEPVEDMKRYVVAFVLSCQSIRAGVLTPSSKMLVLPTSDLFLATLKSLTNVQSDLSVCLAVRRGAMKSSDQGALTFATLRAKRILETGCLYMETMEQAMKSIYADGRTLGNHLIHLKPYLSASVSYDAIGHLLKRLP